MSELDDIRKMIDPRDLYFVRRHSGALHENQVLDVTSAKYGGGSQSPAVKFLQIGVVTAALCAAVVAGVIYWRKRK